MEDKCIKFQNSTHPLPSSAICLIKKSGHTLGTGFFAEIFGRRCIITCNHVLPNRNSVAHCEAYFNSNLTPENPAKIASCALSAKRLIVTSPKSQFDPTKLDYTFVGVDDTAFSAGNSLAKLKPITIDDTVGTVDKEQNITVYHHPDGSEKVKVTNGIVTNKYRNKRRTLHADGPFVEYTAETKHGSSGGLVTCGGRYQLPQPQPTLHRIGIIFHSPAHARDF